MCIFGAADPERTVESLRDKAKSMEQIAALTKAMDATEAPRGPRLWTWCKMKDLALVNGMDPPFPGSAGQDS